MNWWYNTISTFKKLSKCFKTEDKWNIAFLSLSLSIDIDFFETVLNDIVSEEFLALKHITGLNDTFFPNYNSPLIYLFIHSDFFLKN